MWSVRTTEIFDAWFADLGEEAQAEIIATVELLKLLGPRLGRPHADTLNGSKYANMKELRARTSDAVLRVAFAFDPERTGILLIGGNKTGIGQRLFYRQLIQAADDLYAAHLAALHSRKKGRR